MQRLLSTELRACHDTLFVDSMSATLLQLQSLLIVIMRNIKTTSGTELSFAIDAFW